MHFFLFHYSISTEIICYQKKFYLKPSLVGPKAVQLSYNQLHDKYNSLSCIERLKNLTNKFGVCVESIGIGGGLGLLWDKSLSVSLQSFSINHIDVLIDACGVVPKWRFMGFYGEPEVINRWKGWELLNRLKDTSLSPWLVAGDFNEIVSNGEKEGGGPPRALWQMRNFRECLANTDLHDLGYNGFN